MINTLTLTCAHCGSAEFTRVGSNEYRCNRCESVTLVEDDVAARLEQLLLSMQRPQRELNSLLIAAGVVGALALLFAVFVVFAVSDNHPPRSAAPVSATAFRPLVDANKIKIEPLRKVYTADGYGQYLIGRLRNESDAVIPGPRLNATLYADQTKLDTHTAGVIADYLRPGEYSVFKIRLPDDTAFSRYTVASDELYPAQIKPRALLGVSKNQLLLNGKTLQFIGVINNPGKIAAERIHVNVMLYNANQQLIGFGDGAPQNASLKPNEQTAFQINCELFGNEPVATYDYLIESERQS